MTKETPGSPPPSPDGGKDKGRLLDKMASLLVDGPYGKVAVVALVALAGAIALVMGGTGENDPYGIRVTANPATVQSIGDVLTLETTFDTAVHVLVTGRDAGDATIVVMPRDPSLASRGIGKGAATMKLAPSSPPWEMIVCRAPFRRSDTRTEAGTFVLPVGCAMSRVQALGSASSGVDGSR